MSYTNDLRRCLEYMESHLDEELPVSELAQRFGYSMYHFCRLFKSVQGVSPGAYLRALRVERAASSMLDGASVTDAASRYGFDTQSGFGKAFKAHFGVTPTEYKKKGGIIMTDPEIKKIEGFSAIGYKLAPPEGDFDPTDEGAYWLGKDFSSVSNEEYVKLTYPGYAEIGAWIQPDDVSGELCYFLGPQVKSKDYIPKGMIAIDIPAAEYAVFTVPQAANAQQLHDNIRKTWKYIFSEWFDASPYKYDESKMDFELYRGENTYIYVPVLKA